MSKAVKISDGNFNREVIKADKPVLVDFYADWCSPCKMIKPIVEDIANEYEDQVKVCKLDVDGNQKTAAKYSVMSIPTIILFENGKIKDKMVGYVPKQKLVSKLGLK